MKCIKKHGISTADLTEKLGRNVCPKTERWQNQNREARSEYKKRIENEGTFADRHEVWHG